MLLLPSPLPSHVPQEVRARAGAETGRRFRGNCSGADVFRVDAPAADNGEAGEGSFCFLKVQFAAAGAKVELRAERDRIAWLAERTDSDPDAAPSVARVLAYEEREVKAGDGLAAPGIWSYLLTTAVPGRALSAAIDETPIRAGRLMGNALRWLHTLDGSGLVLRRHEELLDEAERRVESGLVRSSNLSRGGDPRAAAKLLKKLRRRVPRAFTPVVSHGDYCLPNVMADLSDRPGLIDLGAMAVADRHLDVACAVRSLRHNGGKEDVVRVFRNWYGPDDIDADRLDFYGDLCELL